MRKKKIYIFFASTLAIIIAFTITAIVRTNYFNSQQREISLSDQELFKSEYTLEDGLNVHVRARNSTWSKIFDFDNVGLTENNYKAYTYDFYIENHSSYDVKEFEFKFTFDNDAYLSSAWNGQLEIHQNVLNNEVVEKVQDLREYEGTGSNLEYYVADGDEFIHMYKGDYFIYIPSSSASAVEMPIESHEATVPGMIIYVKIGESIENSSLFIQYKLSTNLISDIFFGIAVILSVIWFVVFIMAVVGYSQYRKYKARHDRDNEIISESIETFTGFIDAKDPYTNGHSKRVATYSKQIAEKLGFSEEELDNVYYISLLHDCGKIGVPDNILGKPGKLTEEEFEIIKSHTVHGGEILSRFKSLDNVEAGALYHHERYDGKGYPQGLKGEQIPLIARIICVADSFDAMNSNRIYRDKLTKEYIISELTNNKGTQFDPKIAEIMLSLIEEGKVTIN
ncbi:MAG: HD-GYP domain-containing protein [Acholeplasmatales bacterium]|nr:HD-GYP domain-containing protein [Acholeplasmatales bacterium]